MPGLWETFPHPGLNSALEIKVGRKKGLLQICVLQQALFAAWIDQSCRDAQGFAGGVASNFTAWMVNAVLENAANYLVDFCGKMVYKYVSSKSGR